MTKRKAYKPRMIGRPIGGAMRDKLVIAEYCALQVIRTDKEPEHLEWAFNCLAGFNDWVSQAMSNRKMQFDPLFESAKALQSMQARYEKHGTPRPTGEEFSAVSTAVAWADDQIGKLTTADVIKAATDVYESLYGSRRATA